MKTTYTYEFSITSGVAFAKELSKLLSETKDKLIKLEINEAEETAIGTLEKAD